MEPPQPPPGGDRRNPDCPPWPDQTPPLVLIVEDHDDTRSMLSLLLSMFGCRVVEAEDGQQAINVATRTPPDLILLDMKIPLLDGLTVTRLIRSNPNLRQIPIVAVTGNAFPKFKEQVLRAGCDCCLIKPIDLDLLEALIKRLVRSSASAPTFKSQYPLALRSRAAVQKRESYRYV